MTQETNFFLVNSIMLNLKVFSIMNRLFFSKFMFIALFAVYFVPYNAVFAQVTQSSSLVQAAKISAERAEEIAIKRVGGGTIMEIDLERKNQQISYEVEIYHEGQKYEIKIDATTGEITKFKDKPLKKPSVKSQTGSLVQVAKIKFAKAEEIAIKQVGGGTVKEIKLERKNQQTFYKVEITNNQQKYEIKIDAATGEILKFKTEK